MSQLKWFASLWKAHVDDWAGLDDSECVACASKNLKVEGPGVYTCLDCGYEGGSKRAEWIRQKHIWEAAQLAPEVRQAKAGEFLREAHRHLLDAKDQYDQLAKLWLLEADRYGVGDPIDRAASAFASLAMGRHLLDRASDYDPNVRPPAVGEVKLGSQDDVRNQAVAQLNELLEWIRSEPRAALTGGS